MSGKKRCDQVASVLSVEAGAPKPPLLSSAILLPSPHELSTRYRPKLDGVKPSTGWRVTSMTRVTELMTEKAGMWAARSNLNRPRFLVKFCVVPALTQASPPLFRLGAAWMRVVSADGLSAMESAQAG